MQSACLDYALETGQDAGVWGGLTDDERRLLARRQGIDYGNGQLPGPVIHDAGVRVAFMPCHHQPTLRLAEDEQVGCDAQCCDRKWSVRLVVDDELGVYAVWKQVTAAP
jgi:Transcription factor WhiB